MSHWEQLVAGSRGQATVEDFEGAAYRIVAEQVIYAADRGNKTSYWLLEEHERAFRNVLEPMGIGLSINRRLRYACALPRHAKAGEFGLESTLLALVLRKIYDELARRGELDDHEEAFVDLIELSEKFRQSTGGRELPKGGALRDLLRTIQRWGIARRHDETEAEEGEVDQPFAVAIRPAIVDVLGETPLQRLALFATQRSGADPDADDNVEPDPAERGAPPEGRTSEARA